MRPFRNLPAHIELLPPVSKKYLSFDDDARHALAITRTDDETGAQIDDRLRDRAREIKELESEVPKIARDDQLRMRHAEKLRSARQEESRDKEIKSLSDAARAKSSARHQACAAVCLTVKAWFEALPAGTVLRPYGGAPAKPKTGENAAQALDRIRAEGAALTQRRGTVERAPLTKAEQIVAAEAWVRAAGERAAPAVTGLERGAPRVISAAQNLPDIGIGLNRQIKMPDILDLLAWALPEALTAALVGEIDPDTDKVSLTAEARQAKLAELDVAILANERAEESLVLQALEQHHAVQRRPAASPIALLEVVDPAEAPREVAA